MMIRGLSLVLLTGCMASEGAATLSMSQENIWNLTRIEVGMSEAQVLKIMQCPQKKETLEVDGQAYYVWFYVTKPTALSQGRLLKYNVTPLTFKKGVLQGWGFDYYDHIARGPKRYEKNEKPANEGSLQKEINGLIETEEEQKEQKPHGSIILTLNDEKSVSEDDDEESQKKKRKVQGLDDDSQEMIDEEQDENFNFW